MGQEIGGFVFPHACFADVINVATSSLDQAWWGHEASTELPPSFEDLPLDPLEVRLFSMEICIIETSIVVL